MLELHAIAVKKAEGGGRFEVAMTAREKRRFLDGISCDTGAYYNMLGRVNVERSECWRAADRDSIHARIRGSVGFAALGRMMFGATSRSHTVPSVDMSMRWRCRRACCSFVGGFSPPGILTLPYSCTTSALVMSKLAICGRR